LEDQHDGLAGCCDGFEERFLVAGQVEGLAVKAFTGDSLILA